MVPGKLNLTVYKGSTYRYKIELLQANKTPLDLTGCSVAMQVRARPGLSELFLDLTVAGYISITNPVAGEITLEIPADDSEAFDFVSGFYDVKVTFSNGDEFRVLEGAFAALDQVTR